MNRFIRIGLYTLAGMAVLASASFLVLLSRTSPNVELASSPGFDPADLSVSEYRGVRKQSLFVTMEDGVRLAVDVFLPADGPERRAFPVIFEYMPYNRSSVALGMTLHKKVLAKWYTGTWGPVFDRSASRTCRTLVARGYAYVVADMRGCGASFGVHLPLDLQLARDGKVIADWIADQTWCDGNIGMIGQSYLGWAQWAVASQKPKALKCIAPALISFDTYTEALRPGGIAAISWLHQYGDTLPDLQHNVFDPAQPVPRLPCTPVVDEDGDGRLDDEIPLRGKGRPDRFTDDGEPTYTDGRPRKDNVYYRATMEHLKNERPDVFASQHPYFDDLRPFTRGTGHHHESSPGYFLKEVRGSGIAVLNIGAWFDGFAKGTTKLHASLQGDQPSYLFVGPRYHQPHGVIPPYTKYLGYVGSLPQQQSIVTLRFFDHYLKGKKNALDARNPVQIYVVHEGWRKEKEWPLARQQIRALHLAPSNTLTDKPAGEGKDAYRVDFSHASDYGEPQLNRWVSLIKPSRELMVRTGHDTKCYLYETAPLAADLEVTGHPLANLYISSDLPDADVFAYLCDVDERGESVYVTEGQLRAGWHRLHPDDDQVAGAFDVKPDLPWHGHKRDGYDANPLRGGKVVEMRFDFFPIAWVFKKGHRLRLALAGVDAGNFEPNPAMPAADGKSPTVFFHRGGNAASRIELPVIPR